MLGLNEMGFWFLVCFNIAKLFLFYSTHFGHCSRFFKVAFAFIIVFNLFCLLNEEGKVLQYFELLSILYWNKNRFWNKSEKSWERNELPNEKLYMIHFILLFDIFCWLYCFCIVYIDNKDFIKPLYFLYPFTNPSSRFPRGEKLRNYRGIFREIGMGNLGMLGDILFKSL